MTTADAAHDHDRASCGAPETDPRGGRCAVEDAAAHDHDHDHGHDHDHAHGRHDHGGHDHGHGVGGHHHAPTSFGTAFAIATSINVLYIVGEVLWGLHAHALSLLADAGHNLSDVLGLVAAWLADRLRQRAPSARFTYGLRRSTVLAALFNASILLLVTGGIMAEAVMRLIDPAPVAGHVVMWVAGLGILVNGVSALLFLRGQDDLNVRGALVHMASDAAMAAGVVLAGLLIALTGAAWIDPVASLIVSAAVVAGTWSLLRSAVALSLDAVPEGISLDAVRASLAEIPGVIDAHHLHIWSLSTTERALTAHLVCETPDLDLVSVAAAKVRAQFGIGHPTFQLERAHVP